MSSNNRREDQLQAARNLDEASTVLINIGVRVIKKIPIKVTSYFIGLLICLFFTGFKINDQQRSAYYAELDKLDDTKLYQTKDRLNQVYQQYYRNKGWFTCNHICQSYKAELNELQRQHDQLKYEHDELTANAKSKLGIV